MLIFLKIHLTDLEKNKAAQQIADKLNPDRPVIMVSVLGSDTIKSLPTAEMVKVITTIIEKSEAQLLLNYLPSQKEKAKEIYDACSPIIQQDVAFDFYFDGLRDFIAVLSQCNALIGNEGGAVNMAKGVGIPTFTIFSPWINKNSWNMLTDSSMHKAVHLQDYFPEIYGDKHPKEFKDRSLELYTKLTLDLFKNDLIEFLNYVNQLEEDRISSLYRRESI